jgi:hypothetical protein
MVRWLAAHPLLAGGIGLSAAAVAAGVFLLRRRRKKAVESYEDSLEHCFLSKTPISRQQDVLDGLRMMKSDLPSKGRWQRRVVEVEGDTYQTLLERALEDHSISEEEKRKIDQFERITGMDGDISAAVKTELFDVAYLDAIADMRITDDEMAHLRCFAEDLHLPDQVVSERMATVRDCKRAQELELPLPRLDADRTSIHVTRNEELHYVGRGRVFTRRRNADMPDGYEYSLKRDGELILTSRRLCVSDDGKTTVRLSDIDDIDADIDRQMLFIDKTTSGRPTVIGTEEPIYLGRMMELLKVEAGSSG